MTAGRRHAVLLLSVTWSRLAYMTFDPEPAALSGVRVAPLEYMLLAVVAVVIVVSVETVGIALGLLLSYHLDVASGATIILTPGLIFAAGLLVRRR